MVAWSCLNRNYLANTLLHLHIIQDALFVYLHCSDTTSQLSLPYFNTDSVTLSLHSPCKPSLGPLPCFPTILLSKTTLMSWLSLPLGEKKTKKTKPKQNKKPKLPCSGVPCLCSKKQSTALWRAIKITAKWYCHQDTMQCCIKIKDMKHIVKGQRGNYTEKQKGLCQPDILVCVIKLIRRV